MGGTKPKALYVIEGKTVIRRQLEQLRSLYPESEVIVVAGFQATELVEEVRSSSSNAIVLINKEWHSTGTAGSLRKAASISGGTQIVSIDGDVLISDKSLRDICSYDGNSIGVVPATSDSPVYTEISNEML
jgi:choline kinase